LLLLRLRQYGRDSQNAHELQMKDHCGQNQPLIEMDYDLAKLVSDGAIIAHVFLGLATDQHG